MGMKKKILLITPMLHQGGFERICVMTARLLKENWEVVIAVFSMEDIAFDIEGLQIADLNLKARRGRPGKIINLLRRGRKLSRLQKRMGADISYSFGMTANIANALSFGPGRKILACHSFEEIKNGTYMKLISRRGHKILCCSEKMADLVKERYGFTNTEPLWNPCDIKGVLKQSRQPADADLAFFTTEERVLVSMGREDEVKGFWHLIKIFRRVFEEEKDIRLAIIGEGDFTEYKRLAEELGLKEKVLFTGLKKNPFPYLKESDIYLLTSLSEGLPNALVEALALSLPIVSANCLSGPAEILHGDFKEAERQTGVFQGDYGILAPALSPEANFEVCWEEGADKTKIRLEESEEAFAEAVLSLLRDEDLYRHYQQRAVLRAGDFSAEQYMEGLDRAFK